MKPMNMIMQYKKSRKTKTPDEMIISVGEDGLPFADDELLLVADGLGGRGGYAHPEINPDIINPEKFYDIVFAPVLGETDEEFKNYCIRSFDELFKLKDVYFTIPCLENQRTSGYFASRLVSAIVLREFKFNPEMSKQAIFGAVMSEETEELRSAKLKEYGEKLTKTVTEKLDAIATNVNFKVGGGKKNVSSGSYLLPTTLVATLMNEDDEYAYAFYFWAGDSRGYAWDKDGLAQVTEDHEVGGTMTNLITLTRPFTIETCMLRIKKPCVLFNTSDGCYTPPCFASPFDIECLFLQSVMKSDDFEALSENLKNDYGAIANDDSDTMAFAAFGYADYAEFKAAASERWNWIKQNIIEAKLPDILDVDYQADLEDVDMQIAKSVLVIKDKLPPLDGVRQLVEERVVQTNYPPYAKERNQLQSQLDEIKATRNESKAKIKDWVTRYWLAYPCLRKTALPNLADVKKNNPIKDYNECKAKVEKSINDYNNINDELLNEFEEKTREISKKSREILDFSKLDADNPVKDLLKLLNDLDRKLIGNMTKYAIGKDISVKSYIKAYGELKKIDEETVKKESDIIAMYSDSILGGGQAELDKIEMHPEQRAEVSSYLQQIEKCAQEENGVKKEMDALAAKFIDEYWNANVNTLVSLIWTEHRELIPQELLSEVDGDLAQLNAKRKEISKYLEIRQEIYDEYQKGYLRIYKRSELL